MKKFKTWIEGKLATRLSPQKEFVSIVKNWGYRNPFNPREIVIDNKVAVEVTSFGDSVLLQSIRAFQPGQGIGREIMQKLVSLADRLTVTIELDPVPFGTKDLNQQRLISFYQQFGFDGGEEGMIRHPS